MRQAKVKRLPVIDKGGRLLGIVSRADLLKVFAM
jgi:CBS domain-containing protein